MTATEFVHVGYTNADSHGVEYAPAGLKCWGEPFPSDAVGVITEGELDAATVPLKATHIRITETAPATRNTISMAEALELESGDHGGPISAFPNSGWYGGEWYWTDRDYAWVDELAADMEARGWDGPPVCVQFGALRNGHHRVIAAYMAGLTEIPTTTKWSESEDAF